jgi:RNA polymerase sigma-70 factor (ECF subfamily)
METKKTLRLKRPIPFGALADEHALLASARRGDPAASESLVRAHYAEIHRAAWHLLGNADDAQDLAQDCFVKALSGLRRFRGEASIRGWLRRILVHLARDRFRARGRRQEHAALPFEVAELAELAGLERARPSSSPPVEAGRAELSLLVDRALRAMPSNLRVPLVLRAIEGWSYDEIARACGVTAATARTQVMKARRRLHGRIGALLEEDGP